MGKLAIGAAALMVGLVIGVVFGGAMTVGTAAGVGAATGLSAGICSTVIAAQEENLLTAEDVDLVLTRAARDMATIGNDLDGEIVGSSDGCGEVMERLQVASE